MVETETLGHDRSDVRRRKNPCAVGLAGGGYFTTSPRFRPLQFITLLEGAAKYRVRPLPIPLISVGLRPTRPRRWEPDFKPSWGARQRFWPGAVENVHRVIPFQSVAVAVALAPTESAGGGRMARPPIREPPRNPRGRGAAAGREMTRRFVSVVRESELSGENGKQAGRAGLRA